MWKMFCGWSTAIPPLRVTVLIMNFYIFSAGNHILLTFKLFSFFIEVFRVFDYSYGLNMYSRVIVRCFREDSDPYAKILKKNISKGLDVVS